MAQKKAKKVAATPKILERLAPDDRQVLVHAGTMPGCGLGALQKAAGCSKGAAQRTVKRLMEMGLLRRDESSRPFRHFCTTKGYKVREVVCSEA